MSDGWELKQGDAGWELMGGDELLGGARVDDDHLVVSQYFTHHDVIETRIPIAHLMALLRASGIAIEEAKP